MNSFEARSEHDSLYGEIKISGILSKIIDTSEFQRMRRIKQLVGAEYVYKDATHTRYQHSLGTAYLAGLMVKDLQTQMPDRKIDDTDILCVEIAALCHDLGHGPFSYVFLEKVLPGLGYSSRNRKDQAYGVFKKIWMNIVEKDRRIDYLTSRDMVFIKELIRGSAEGQETCNYRGREESKWILYQIFCNRSSEVDACKFDYMSRDCSGFGDLNGGYHDFLKSLENPRGVIEVNENKIVYVPQLRSNWDYLKNLHQTKYQSASVNAVQHMISDAIVWADEYLNISGCLHDLDFFCSLGDHILSEIRKIRSDADPKIRAAKEVLKKLDNGQYYEFVRAFNIKDCECEDVIERIVDMDGCISTQMIRISILSDEATKGCVKDGESVIQVFCVDPYEVCAVRCACDDFLKDLSDDAVESHPIEQAEQCPAT